MNNLLCVWIEKGEKQQSLMGSQTEWGINIKMMAEEILASGTHFPSYHLAMLLGLFFFFQSGIKCVI